jgi:hypothetical protein
VRVRLAPAKGKSAAPSQENQPKKTKIETAGDTEKRFRRREPGFLGAACQGRGMESGGTVGGGPVSDERVHQDLMSILARNFATE